MGYNAVEAGYLQTTPRVVQNILAKLKDLDLQSNLLQQLAMVPPELEDRLKRQLKSIHKLWVQPKYDVEPDGAVPLVRKIFVDIRNKLKQLKMKHLKIKYRREFQDADEDGSGENSTDPQFHPQFHPSHCTPNRHPKPNRHFQNYISQTYTHARTHTHSLTHSLTHTKYYSPGEIDALEVQAAMKKQGIYISILHASAIIDGIDVNGDAVIDEGEFVAYMLEMAMGGKKIDNPLMRFFGRMFDKRGPEENPIKFLPMKLFEKVWNT